MTLVKKFWVSEKCQKQLCDTLVTSCTSKSTS